MSHQRGARAAHARAEFGSDLSSSPMVRGSTVPPCLSACVTAASTSRSSCSQTQAQKKPETIAYLPVIDGWLQRQEMPLIHRVKRRSPRAGDTSLHAECLRKSVLPSLAYGGHSCSLKWKVDPQWAFTRDFLGWDRRQQRWPHGPTITKLIGYDASPADARRIANATGKWPPGHRNRYPLMEWGWTHDRCEQVILAGGLPLPMKSACWMCLASKKHEVDWLNAAHPDLAALSVEMERRAHQRG